MVRRRCTRARLLTGRGEDGGTGRREVIAALLDKGARLRAKRDALAAAVAAAAAEEEQEKAGGAHMETDRDGAAPVAQLAGLRLHDGRQGVARGPYARGEEAAVAVMSAQDALAIDMERERVREVRAVSRAPGPWPNDAT